MDLPEYLYIAIDEHDPEADIPLIIGRSLDEVVGRCLNNDDEPPTVGIYRLEKQGLAVVHREVILKETQPSNLKETQLSNAAVKQRQQLIQG